MGSQMSQSFGVQFGGQLLFKKKKIKKKKSLIELGPALCNAKLHRGGADDKRITIADLTGVAVQV